MCMLAMQLSGFTNASSHVSNQGLIISSQCYAAQITSYTAFLSRNFDDSFNDLNAITFKISINDNEV